MIPELKQKPDNWAQEAMKILRPGMILYGFCAGFFGRNSYSDKRIVGVSVLHIEDNGPILQIDVYEDGYENRAMCTSEKDVKDLINSSNENMEDENG